MAVYTLGERRLICKSDEWFIAPSADVIGNVQLGHQASIWFGCVLRGDNDPIIIGDGSNIQDNSVLHTDAGTTLSVGNDVTVGHKVMLHGCIIGDGCLIGINAVILNGASIGAGSLVGAHSLVPEGKTYPAGVMIMGTPARVVRELTPEEQQRVRRSAKGYVKNAERYRRELKPA